MIYTKYKIDNDLFFSIGLCNRIKDYPYNGGLRINYQNMDVEKTSITLARIMDQKHKVYNTGFTGSKIVAYIDHSLSSSNEKRSLLLTNIAEMLNARQDMYTGFDVNVTCNDISYLKIRTNFILAGDQYIDTSFATAYGGVASLYAALNYQSMSLKLRVLVHGYGNVGKSIAEILTKRGCEVYVYDVAAISCHHKFISSEEEIWRMKFDVIILASISNIINPQIICTMNTNILISIANDPFTNDNECLDLLKVRKIMYLPEALTSAGAVICDSIEHYNSSAFTSENAQVIYDFVYKSIYDKTIEFLNKDRNLLCIYSNSDNIIGIKFKNSK